ncbi:MAG: hypothetical protein OEY44_02805 [Candidatus Peregrinibacteria bacterium]|nr:hypothetical protein [Candidatus Peregrinibacteria bacterium]
MGKDDRHPLEAEVAERLRDITTSAQFRELHKDIEDLAPGLDEALVYNLRFMWYAHGLNNFQERFAQLILKKMDGWELLVPDKPTGIYAAPWLVATQDVIDYFLRKNYLGPHFTDAYVQVRRLYEQLAVATKDSKRAQHWQESLDFVKSLE